MAGKRSLLTADDIHGAWAIMPTPAKPDASDWRAEDTVDLDETTRVVNALIDAGVDGILTLGTFGEGGMMNFAASVAFQAPTEGALSRLNGLLCVVEHHAAMDGPISSDLFEWKA